MLLKWKRILWRSLYADIAWKGGFKNDKLYIIFHFMSYELIRRCDAAKLIPKMLLSHIKNEHIKSINQLCLFFLTYCSEFVKTNYGTDYRLMWKRYITALLLVILLRLLCWHLWLHVMIKNSQSLSRLKYLLVKYATQKLEIST